MPAENGFTSQSKFYVYFLEWETSSFKIFMKIKCRYKIKTFYKAVQFSETATGGVLLKKVFLKISQNSQENTGARAYFLIKLMVWGMQLYSKGDFGTGVFLWVLRNL